jgi:hypothetical protein
MGRLQHFQVGAVGKALLAAASRRSAARELACPVLRLRPAVHPPVLVLMEAAAAVALAAQQETAPAAAALL